MPKLVQFTLSEDTLTVKLKAHSVLAALPIVPIPPIVWTEPKSNVIDSVGTILE